MKKIISILLVMVMLLAILSGCSNEKPKARAFNAETLIVYEDSITSRTSAEYLCQALRPKMGVLLKTVSHTNFNGDLATGNYIFIGETGLITEQKNLGNNAAEIALYKEGLSIRGQDAFYLHLAVVHVVDLWGSNEEYGLKDDALWIDVDVAEKLNTMEEKGDQILTVMSQNVLINAPGWDAPDERMIRLNELIKKYTPDLLGMQEVSYTWYGLIKEYLGDEYGIIGHSRDGVDATTGEWAPVLYRKTRFEVLDSGCFWLSDTPDVPSTYPEAYVARTCSWAKLKDKQTGKELLFANTHLDPSLENHDGSVARPKQMAVITNFLKDYVGECAVYLTGDFNMGLGNIAVNENLASAKAVGALNTSNVTGTCGGSEIDFIFYNRLFSRPIQYHVCDEKYNGTKENDPMAEFISDHYGIIGRFLPL